MSETQKPDGLMVIGVAFAATGAGSQLSLIGFLSKDKILWGKLRNCRPYQLVGYHLVVYSNLFGQIIFGSIYLQLKLVLCKFRGKLSLRHNH